MGNLGFQELLFLSVFVVPFVFYLLSLQKALQSVTPVNRKMEPGLVWLLFIPGFNLIWNFFVVDAIGISFKREYEKYGQFKTDKPTYNLGLTLAILECCLIIPVLNALAAIGGFVIWIIYWVKVSQVTTDILNLAQTYGRGEGDKTTSIFN